MNKFHLLDRELSIVEVVAFAEDSTIGQYVSDKNEIQIAANLDSTVRQYVLLHELIHAMLGITGITNLLEEKQEEAVCDALALGFNNVLKHNKEMFFDVGRNQTR